LELWAIARYDLHLTDDEFYDLTPGMFYALCKRRNIHFKYNRLAHALTASAIYNVNRASSDAPLVQPFDFIREYDPKQEQTNEIKKVIKEVVGSLPAGTPLTKYVEIRSKTIQSLQQQGRKDAEQLFNECWPHLKPVQEA
jgi:hypothetical protein